MSDYQPNVPEWWRKEYQSPDADQLSEKVPAPIGKANHVVHFNIFISTLFAYFVTYLVSGDWRAGLSVAGFVLVISLKISRARAAAQ
jgi:hypothetical protein